MASSELGRDTSRQRLVTPNLATVFQALEGAKYILLAVSGGPDSTALMHLAARWNLGHRGARMAVASVDHGLRAGARDEAEAVMTQASALGFDARILVWTGPKPQRVNQEQARLARYTLLEAHAAELGATHLVTAHTLDDQAETILFRLARGSGMTGLIGMRPDSLRGELRHVRPFLGTKKADIVALCRHEGWSFVTDPSNDDATFARTRWRALTPRLDAEGLTAERLGRLAERLARAEAALTALAKTAALTTSLACIDGSKAFAMKDLAAFSEEIVLRVLSNALLERAGPRGVRLQRLETLVHELLAAFAQGRRMRRSLGRSVVSLGSDGVVRVGPEPPRRRPCSEAQSAQIYPA